MSPAPRWLSYRIERRTATLTCFEAVQRSHILGCWNIRAGQNSLAFLISTCPTSVLPGRDGLIGANANSNGVLNMSQPINPFEGRLFAYFLSPTSPIASHTTFTRLPAKTYARSGMHQMHSKAPQPRHRHVTITPQPETLIYPLWYTNVRPICSRA